MIRLAGTVSRKRINRPKEKWARSFVALFLITLPILPFYGQRQAPQFPHLRKAGTATQLIVDGKPFLVLGGELGNSSSSSLEYMQPVWDKLARLNLNTVLTPVYWELIEPTEGKYDFTIVDGLIAEARKHNLKLVPLWFASWKNSMSCYAPAWVKTNERRFPRSQDANGRGMEILSPFSTENVDADTKAFAAFMRHLRQVDDREHTVIMVQVENEIGMIPDSRDRSAVANKLFADQVPGELIKYLAENKEKLIPEFRSVWAANGFKTRGTWEEVFAKGAGTDEIFMAWYFAQYTERVAAAGKREYPLPMFVNAALIRLGYQPGQYPSAGPLPHIMDVWRAGAPGIDFLSPDIYFPTFTEWSRKYHQSGNPLFIPEAILNNLSAVNAMYAIGQHDAMGFSPFSIESADDAASDSVRSAYDVLRQFAPLILEHQGKGETVGLLPDSSEPQRVPQKVRLGGYMLNITYERPPSATVPASGGLAISLGRDEFVFAGTGLVITFDADSVAERAVGILSAAEGRFINGQWQPGRRLNGDQTHQGRHIRLAPGKFDIQRVKLYTYH